MSTPSVSNTTNWSFFTILFPLISHSLLFVLVFSQRFSFMIPPESPPLLTKPARDHPCTVSSAPSRAVFCSPRSRSLEPQVRSSPHPLGLFRTCLRPSVKSKPPPAAAGGGSEETKRAGMRSDGRKQDRNSADGCGEDRASVCSSDRGQVHRSVQLMAVRHVKSMTPYVRLDCGRWWLHHTGAIQTVAHGVNHCRYTVQVEGTVSCSH